MEQIKFHKRPESYGRIKTMTDEFRKAAETGTLKLSPDQPLGIILSVKELIDIATLAFPDDNLVLLFGIDGEKLTASFLGCNNRGDITSSHYREGREGQETWDNTTANARSDSFPVQADMTPDNFEIYMPDPSKGTATPDVEEANDAIESKSETAGEYETDELHEKALQLQSYGTPPGPPFRVNLARTKYNDVKTQVKHYQTAVQNGKDLSLAKVGIFLKTTDLDRIKELATTTSGAKQGVLMMHGLENEGDPSSLTVAFVDAETDGTHAWISNKHKDVGEDGEETWHIKTALTIGENIDDFLNKPN